LFFLKKGPHFWIRNCLMVGMCKYR
jgi:hypothetical protein